jgi:hypothetical protein
MHPVGDVIVTFTIAAGLNAVCSEETLCLIHVRTLVLYVHSLPLTLGFIPENHVRIRSANADWCVVSSFTWIISDSWWARFAG